MLRNRAPASVLQKTYDESYLTCSTAVYYESQGNEKEATRCWKAALEQIYDHHANKATPNYIPRSETEKALVESLRQLELQCKERIDLLEALRLSRQDGTLPSSASVSSASASASGSAQNDPSDSPRPRNRLEKGWIGNGTIPAITYTELSKPANIEMSRRKRPSDADTPKASASPLLPQPQPSPSPSASSPKQIFAPPPYPPPGEPASSRPSSPERHTMRTTLRSRKPGDKPPKRDSNRNRAKPPEPPGASEAATLAWASLGRSAESGELAATPPPPPPVSRSTPSLLRKQWDSHTRRLVSLDQGLRITPPVERRNSDLVGGKPTRDQDGDEPPAYPSQISVTAASTALGALSRDAAVFARSSLERARAERKKTMTPPGKSTPAAPASTPARRSNTDILSPTDQGNRESRRKKSPTGGASVRRKEIGGAALSAAGRGGTPGSKTPRSSSKLSSYSLATKPRQRSKGGEVAANHSPSSDEGGSRLEGGGARPAKQRKPKDVPQDGSPLQRELAEVTSGESADEEDEEDRRPDEAWKKRKADILRRLPAGVDESAAKQILNEIVVHGDEVRWDDIAGLEPAKSALREAVVYPFLRPDLFKGLREPARGMLLFGPPGTGKTMLARAVATESHSTFFSISASSLTSKYLGESEKLVRALFALAKTLAPSIIFFDEIDSLLSQRSSAGEHEASRRIKTEFFIQWSALQRAAAGREPTTTPSGPEDTNTNTNKNNSNSTSNSAGNGTTADHRATPKADKGDVNRVLVLAATNLPWAIDEAARRRFVRRQYIPLPEAQTRATHLRTLLRQQKHSLSDADMATLVGLTDGFSGSDVTALAKDAAMGPLRALGEALLLTRTDEIRPIGLADFIASLASIRPSVSRTSLKEYEDWAEEFGERGG